MNKILCFILAFALLFAGVVATADTPLILGDVNGDGLIDAQDALLVLQYSVDKANLTQEQVTAADTTGENDPSAKDALCILQKAVDMIRHFPVEITNVPFVSWDRASENTWYYQISEKAKEHVGVAMVCTSYEEWRDLILSDMMFCNAIEPSKEQLQQKNLARYPQAYFDQGNSLVLFSIRSGSSSVRAFVKSMYMTDGELNLKIDIEYPDWRTGDYLTKLYLVEVQQNCSSVTDIHIQADCLEGDLKNNYTLSERVHYDFPVQ